MNGRTVTTIVGGRREQNLPSSEDRLEERKVGGRSVGGGRKQVVSHCKILPFILAQVRNSRCQVATGSYVNCKNVFGGPGAREIRERRHNSVSGGPRESVCVVYDRTRP